MSPLVRRVATPALPVELIHLVLDEVVGAGDSSTLKTMSLVCSWFTPSCRSGLFRSVTVPFASDSHYAENSSQSKMEAQQFQALIAFLDASPHILRCIRHLVLLDLSRIWSVPVGAPTWATVAQPLCRLVARLRDEGLHGLEIRSEIQLDWTSFDAAIKESIYGVFRTPRVGGGPRGHAGVASTTPFLRHTHTHTHAYTHARKYTPHLRIAGVVNIQDADIWTLLSSAPHVTVAHACFSLQGVHSKLSLSSPSPSAPDGDVPLPSAMIMTPETLRLGRSMGDNALEMVRHYPGILGRVRRLTIESLSAAAAVSQFWTVALASRDTLEHLEWLLEDLAYRTQQDARELQRLDLSVFPHLRSICIRSSQTGLLVNLMVILEATGAENRIERITIIMPDYIDKFVTFVPSMVWKRLDTTLGGAKFSRHLREVVLCFTWKERPVSQQSLAAVETSFRRNLPSVDGPFCRLEVVQERLAPL